MTEQPGSYEAVSVLDGETLAAMTDRELRLAHAETLAVLRVAQQDADRIWPTVAEQDRATEMANRLYRARVLYEAEMAVRDDARRDREIAARVGGQP